MKKVAVILSGCGVFDGSEIYEGVLTFLALARNGASVTCAAPSIRQKHVINHLTGEVSENEQRNVLEEAARLARGEIVALGELRLAEHDAVIFVGGYGAAKNLSSFAFDGESYDVDPNVADLIEKAADAGKPQGFICISPALAAAVLGGKGIRLTAGNDAATAAVLESKGAVHENCDVEDIVIDEANKVVSTPAYMLAENLLQAETGINKLVEKVIAMA